MVPVVKILSNEELYDRVFQIKSSLESAGLGIIKSQNSALSLVQGRISQNGIMVRVVTTVDENEYKILFANKDKILQIGEVIGPEPIVAKDLVPGKRKLEIYGKLESPVHAEMLGVDYAESIGMKEGTIATSLDGCSMCEEWLKKYHPNFMHVNLKSERLALQKAYRDAINSMVETKLSGLKQETSDAIKGVRIKRDADIKSITEKAKGRALTNEEKIQIKKIKEEAIKKIADIRKSVVYRKKEILDDARAIRNLPRKGKLPPPTEPPSPVKPGIVNPQETARATAEKGLDNAVEERALAQTAAHEAENIGANEAEKTVAKDLGQAAAKDVAQGKSLLSRMKFSPKLKTFREGAAEDAFLILFDIFEEWAKKKDYQSMLKIFLENLRVEIKRIELLENTKDEFKKFRSDIDSKIGYQLYYRVTFNVISVAKIKREGGKKIGEIIPFYPIILQIEIDHSKGDEVHPVLYPENEDDKEYIDGHKLKTSGRFYIPIFASGLDITTAVEDAANRRFQKISLLVNPNYEAWKYLRDFEEYVGLFPLSDAAKNWNNLSAQLYFELLLIGTGVYQYGNFKILKAMPFDTIMQMVKWYPGEDINFIKSFQLYLNTLPQNERSSLSSIYRKYLDRLRKDRMCDYDCHKPAATAVPLRLPQLKAAPVKVVPPVIHKKPVFIEKGDKMLTESCHKPNDRLVTDPLTEIRIKTSD